jgi:very-short-patch-repair endonuclease
MGRAESPPPGRALRAATLPQVWGRVGLTFCSPMTIPFRSGAIRGTSRQVEHAARRLRAEPTPAEEALWQALRAGRLDGLRFRRQHPVGRFVLDFCCPAIRLVVEADGGIHDEQVERDEARAEVLHAFGYTTVRIRNEEVLADLPSALAKISAAATALRSTR